MKNLQRPPNFSTFSIFHMKYFLIPKVEKIILAVPGTLSGELQGKLGLEASENSIFQKLTSKIGLNSNFATFTKKSKIWNCHKNWLVTGMKLKFPGNAYLIDSNKWWKFQRNWRTFIAMTALARTVIDWNDPAISKDLIITVLRSSCYSDEIRYHIANATQTVNGMQFSVYESLG